MKIVKLFSVFVLSMSIFESGVIAAERNFPSNLRLPQICKYTVPHDDFGTVYIEKNNEASIKVTGLRAATKLFLMNYMGTFSNGQIIFMKDNSGLPPEVKLLPNGGDTVFYGGDNWGYDVHCDVNKNDH